MNDKESDILILREKKDDYFLKYITNGNIQNFYKIKIKNSNSFYKILKKTSLRYWDIVLDYWKADVKKYKQIIIFDAMYETGISRYIKNKNRKCKIIFYFWNNISHKNIHRLKDNNIDEFWTFNKNDAEKYNINYNPQFYTKNIKLSYAKKNNDILFLGRDKNRKKLILDLKDQLEEKGIKTQFIIIENENDYISYEEYLNEISKSKMLLDIVENKENSGLTLRVLESLFFNKKLITNNKDIKNYDFYNPNNIFILGEDNLDKINKFINSPYELIDKNIIEQYDFENWIARFSI